MIVALPGLLAFYVLLQNILNNLALKLVHLYISLRIWYTFAVSLNVETHLAACNYNYH